MDCRAKFGSMVCAVQFVDCATSHFAPNIYILYSGNIFHGKYFECEIGFCKQNFLRDSTNDFFADIYLQEFCDESSSVKRFFAKFRAGHLK